jgi:penicillin G amidase
MRLIPFLSTAIITTGLVTVLNSTLVLPAPLGKVLNPQSGVWQNAEKSNEDFNANLSFPNLKGEANVYFDERLVPHVFAQNDEDAYFIQGYLHAKFRLFQMDLQTKAAEGRASEIAGAKAIQFDREQRRLGMRYAAENSLAEMEKDPKQKALFDAYTNGINAYIEKLSPKNYPLEYKVLNIEPEKWSNIRTALLLKMMAKMLSSGTESDLESKRFVSAYDTQGYCV